MTVKESQAVRQKKGSAVQQHEDAALKTSMQFFAKELLPYFNIEGDVVAFAPTELIQLDISRLFQDFNLVMKDGSWKHFEFQSKNEGKIGLKRFRAYEAMSSYQNKVAVTTYVLYSGNIKNPMTEFTEGVNRYRICPIIMRGQNSDMLSAGIRQRLDAGEEITKEMLVPLTLCPLMGGEMTQKDRIMAAFDILRRVPEVDAAELRKIEAVVYAMADKFLESKELEEIMEAVRMTKLGQMLVDKGIQEGIEQGIEQGIERGIERGEIQMFQKYNRLILKLAEDGKSGLLEEAAGDPKKMEQLFKVYGL